LTNKENDDGEKNKTGGNGLSDNDLKLISDLTKRINEAEKTIKTLISISPEIPKMRERVRKKK